MGGREEFIDNNGTRSSMEEDNVISLYKGFWEWKDERNAAQKDQIAFKFVIKEKSFSVDWKWNGNAITNQRMMHIMCATLIAFCSRESFDSVFCETFPQKLMEIFESRRL